MIDIKVKRKRTMPLPPISTKGSQFIANIQNGWGRRCQNFGIEAKGYHQYCVCENHTKSDEYKEFTEDMKDEEQKKNINDEEQKKTFDDELRKIEHLKEKDRDEYHKLYDELEDEYNNT
jgi:hypothetical protein